jgi:electron transport complex protein RnfA
MTDFALLMLSTAIINNVVLVKFLGLCPFMGVSKKVDTAFGMGLATTFVITMASGACWALENFILLPFGIEYLRILVYILVIAAVVQFVEMVVRKSAPDLYQTLGIYLPLITTNCAVLGLPLINSQEKATFFNAVMVGFGSSVGFTLVLLMFAGLRERLALARVPGAFGGAPIAFMTASLLALSFMGFSGLNFK